jgi:hypothetical protein
MNTKDSNTARTAKTDSLMYALYQNFKQDVMRQP